MDFLVPLYVGWSIPSAVLARWLALENGYHGWTWGIAGFFLGPLAVLAVGLAPRGFVDFKACIECAEPIRPTATKCPHCGTDLLAEENDSEEIGL